MTGVHRQRRRHGLALAAALPFHLTHNIPTSVNVSQNWPDASYRLRLRAGHSTSTLLTSRQQTITNAP